MKDTNYMAIEWMQKKTNLKFVHVKMLKQKGVQWMCFKTNK